MNPFVLEPLPLLIEADVNDPREVEGILNPAAARGPDGELYLFPRIVGKGNYSRIGIMRVIFDTAGEPQGVERIGIALEPEAPYELRGEGMGGCEDPRVTYVEPIEMYVMTYTAFSLQGPRIAIAVSRDLLHWDRLGLAKFGPVGNITFDNVDNKDAVMFPRSVPGPSGELELALLHRPYFSGEEHKETLRLGEERKLDLSCESIWLSFGPIVLDNDPEELIRFATHIPLATPQAPWESLKIGTGTPPVLTPEGWLIVYHGVSSAFDPDLGEERLTYSAGITILAEDNPLNIVYRTQDPILAPVSASGPRGTAANVVFPTGIDRRDDIGQPDRFDVYYGINDFRIGVARLDFPVDEKNSIVERSANVTPSH
jgi:predicted GH43/DUF377 family glycosyl hydrolase